MEKEHPFYGTQIIPRQEKEYIESLLRKYDKALATDDLKAKIWDELQMEKHKGNITIPFKIVTRIDPSKKYPDYIEIVLDTKV
ncbi:MAG: hypothetical protein ACH350_06040 [Parachlamydiaceae bacterium]